MTKVIELRPDKSLINQTFEKYQFSSDQVIIDLENDLATDVYRQEPKSGQDSWLEARIFAFHNHLFKNPFDSSCWYVDANRNAWRLGLDGDLSHRHSLAVKDRESFVYNPSIVFASERITALSDGGETLEILVENSSRQLETFSSKDLGPCVLLDSRYVQDESLLIVAACCVNEINGKKCSQLVLSSYEFRDDESSKKSLTLLRKQIFNVKGPVEYVFIESKGNFIHMVSQDTATLEFDSLKPTMIESNENSSADKEKLPETKIPKYCWSQDEDSLTVWIKVAEIDRDEFLRIVTTSISIKISIRDVVLIQGDFQHRLDHDLTTWSRENDTIKLELVKHESGLMWNELIRGDTGGECLPNEALAAEIHSRLSHLCTSEPETTNGEGQPLVGFNAEQLEECDMLGRDNFLQRINLDDHKTTHLVMLGSSNRVLFTHKLKSGQRVCLRHDHHGCVWFPSDDDPEEWIIRHVHTFPGFGYVEASKTNKKFCVSPPNGSYVAIVEHTRHAFLYEKPEDSAKIAKQRIVDIGPESKPIMGVAATNKHLILLTTNKLYRLVIYP